MGFLAVDVSVWSLGEFRWIGPGSLSLVSQVCEMRVGDGGL